MRPQNYTTKLKVANEDRGTDETEIRRIRITHKNQIH